MIERNWHKCYGEGWGDLLVSDAYAHPAKFSRALIRRIYEHCLEEGYLAPGGVVLDPFAGVGLGALHAMMNGLEWIGVELEQRFVDWGCENIDMWNKKFRALPNWSGQAVLIQGDSRELEKVVGKAQSVLSSPPYQGGGHHKGVFDTWGGQLEGEKGCAGWATKEGCYGISRGQMETMPQGDHAAVVSSPPYAGTLDGREGPGARWDFKTHSPGNAVRQTCDPDYGRSPGQLAAMPAGDVDAVCTSPPYNPPMSQDHSGTKGGKRGHTPSEPGAFHRYGNTLGQLEGLPMGDVDAVCGSPPYEASRTDQEFQRKAADPNVSLSMPESTKGYGAGGIGRERTQETVETFWSAARTIMFQCHAIIKPGGVAVWVVKAFVRDKTIVDFPDQWRQLGETCGFETLEWIRAWLVEDRGTQVDLWGNHHKRKVERKSFFRRLYESKYPENSIDYEVVLIQRKSSLT